MHFSASLLYWSVIDNLVAYELYLITNVYLGVTHSMYSSKQSSGLFRFTKHKETISEEVKPDTLKVSPSGLEIVNSFNYNFGSSL